MFILAAESSMRRRLSLIVFFLPARYFFCVDPSSHKVTVFLIVVPPRPHGPQPLQPPHNPNDERLHLVKRVFSNKQAYLSSVFLAAACE